MPPSITCTVKCRPNPRLAPQQPAAALELPAATDMRAASARCRSPPSLSLSRSADPPEPRAHTCRGGPSARRARAAVAVGGVGGGGDSSPALMLAGALSRYAIFRDDLVRRAFAAAEAAHRGQVGAGAGPCRLSLSRLLALAFRIASCPSG